MPLEPQTTQQLKDLGLISEDTFGRFAPGPVAPEISIPEPVQNIVGNVKDGLSRLGDTAVQMTKDNFANSLPGQIISMGKAGLEGVASQAKQFAEPGYFDKKAPEPVVNPELTAPEDSGPVVAPDYLRAQSQSAQGPSLMAGAQGSLMSAMNAQKAAVTEGAEIGAKQAAEEATYQQTLFDRSEAMRAENEAREGERQKRLLDKESTLNAKMDAFAKQPATIAEKFADAGLGQKIMMGLSLFLGAAPNSSGQNKAVATMQAAIDADIKKSKEDVNNSQSIYQELRSTFKDDRQAEAAARIAYLENAQLKVNQIASQYKSPQLLANAKLLNGKIDEEKAKYRVAFAQAVGQSAGMQDADETMKKIMRLPKELQKEALKERGTLENLAKAKSTLHGAYETIKKISAAAGNMPFSKTKSEVEAARSTIMATIVANWKGPMSDTDLERIDGFLPSSTDTPAQVDAKDAAMMQLIEGQADPTPTLKGFGLLPKEAPKPGQYVRNK